MALPVVMKVSRRAIPITMKTRGVSLDETLKEAVYSKMRYALGRFGERVREILVWIEDTNGPREGSGIRCRTDIILARNGRLSATAEAANEFAAVAECATRARTLLDRHIKRRRRTRRLARADRS